MSKRKQAPQLMTEEQSAIYALLQLMLKRDKSIVVTTEFINVANKCKWLSQDLKPVPLQVDEAREMVLSIVADCNEKMRAADAYCASIEAKSAAKLAKIAAILGE